MNNKESFGQTLLLFWKRIFDYKGKSSLRQFWFPVLFNALLAVPAIASLVCIHILEPVDFERTVLLAVAAVFLIYQVIALIPFISLTVRRLRDGGKSGWWACLITVIGIGLIIVLCLCTLQSAATPQKTERRRPERHHSPFENVYDPADNEIECIYGPPEMFESDDDNFDPAENDPVCIYGPPEMFEEGENNYDPVENEMECIYGPPEMFEDGEN